MNNIYVDELPKDCSECKLGYFYDCQYCFLRPDLAEKQEWCEKEKHCQLKSLSDRLAEERKKVCGQLKDYITRHYLASIKGNGDIFLELNLTGLNTIFEIIEDGKYENFIPN